jgi:hypothetical protein
VTVGAVDSATGKRKESNCNLEAMSKLNCVLCCGWM